MVSLDLSLFTAADIERLLTDVEATLRDVLSVVAPLPGVEIPVSRLILIKELETKRTLYRQRLIELGRRESSVSRDMQRSDRRQPEREPVVMPARGNAPRRARPPGPSTILFLAANPRDTDHLRLGDECAEIHRQLQLAPHRDDFRFESRWSVDVDELMRHLQEVDPVVIHFSGHGGGKAGVYLEDRQELHRAVTARGFAMMVRAAALHARLVVLNACYTTVQAEALRACVDCVIGMDGAIDDESARVFATRFYGALGNRRSIGNALDSGVAALIARQLPGEQMPQCLTREGLPADEIVLGAE